MKSDKEGRISPHSDNIRGYNVLVSILKPCLSIFNNMHIHERFI